MVAVGVGRAILNLRQDDSSMRRECFGVLGTLRQVSLRGTETSQGYTASQWKSWEKDASVPAPRLVPGLAGDMQMVVRTVGAGRWAGVRWP